MAAAYVGVERVALGSHFYLWTPEAGVPDNRRVFIACHGGYRDNDMFQPLRLNITLFFYTKKGTIITTAKQSIGDRYKKKITEHIFAGNSGGAEQDYILRKYQGAHGGADESYDNVAEFVRDEGVCVLTVRNRRRPYVWNQNKYLKLSYAHSLLEKHYPDHFNYYYCGFCRNNTRNPQTIADVVQDVQLIGFRQGPVAAHP